MWHWRWGHLEKLILERKTFKKYTTCPDNSICASKQNQKSYYLCLFVVVVCLLVCPQYMAYKWLGRLLWPFCALARGLSVVNNAYFIALLDKNACTDLSMLYKRTYIEYRYTTHLLWFHIFLSYSSIKYSF